jgi:DNA-binding NarL/FixJ family response regulator
MAAVSRPVILERRGSGSIDNVAAPDPYAIDAFAVSTGPSLRYALPWMSPGAHFLVVDDDPVVARNLSRVVERFGAVVVAGSVSAARAILDSRVRWSGFVIDLGLPDGSGFDIVRAVRRTMPDAPAMVLTGQLDASFVNEAHDLRVHYVVKPVERARIERFCREASGSPGASVIPESLDECISRVRELLTRRPEPIVRWEIGRIIAEVKADHASYGSSGVATLAAAVGEDAPSLYRYATMAETWSEGEVQELCTGKPALTWSHLVALGNIEDAATRQRWIARARAERLSVRELSERLEAEG